jgi:hypothetical protein
MSKSMNRQDSPLQQAVLLMLLRSYCQAIAELEEQALDIEKLESFKKVMINASCAANQYFHSL